MAKRRRQMLVDDNGRRYVHRERPSVLLAPCERGKKLSLDDTDLKTAWRQHWENDRYYGLLRFYPAGFPVGGCRFAVISISAKDETARHDWRDFQQIKNDLLDPEWEALELYPAESRLKDPSNRFYLWAVPPGVIRWGLPGGREVRDIDTAIAPQRPFP